MDELIGDHPALEPGGQTISWARAQWDREVGSCPGGGLDIQGFARHLRSKDRAARTIRDYERELERFGDWFEGTYGRPIVIAELTPIDIREWRAHLETRGARPATVNHALAALRSYCAWERQRGRIVANPTDDVRDKRQEVLAPRSLTRAEVAKLRRAADDAIALADSKRPPIKMTLAARNARRDKAVLHLLLGAGLRNSEICGLRLADLTLNARSGEVVVRHGKGNKWRTVPLNVDTRAALLAWLDVRPRSGAAVSAEGQDEPMFVGRLGNAITTLVVQDIVRGIAQRAGVGGVTPHLLRHTFAKAIIDAGKPITEVQALLGHGSIQTTSRYTTPGLVDLAQAVEAVAWAEE